MAHSVEELGRSVPPTATIYGEVTAMILHAIAWRLSENSARRIRRARPERRLREPNKWDEQQKQRSHHVVHVVDSQGQCLAVDDLVRECGGADTVYAVRGKLTLILRP